MSERLLRAYLADPAERVLAALLFALLALLLFAVAPTAARAADDTLPPTDLVWRCWLAPAGAQAVLCIQPDAPPTDPALDTGPDPLTVRRDLLSDAGGSVARLARTQPAVYGGGAWRVPLHTVPYGDGRLQVLLETVMCGAEPACRVELLALPPAQVATLR